MYTGNLVNTLPLIIKQALTFSCVLSKPILISIKKEKNISLRFSSIMSTASGFRPPVYSDKGRARVIILHVTVGGLPVGKKFKTSLYLPKLAS